MQTARFPAQIIASALAAALALALAAIPARAFPVHALSFASVPVAASPVPSFAARAPASDSCRVFVLLPNVTVQSGFARPKMARPVAAGDDIRTRAATGAPLLKGLQLLVARPCDGPSHLWNS